MGIGGTVINWDQEFTTEFCNNVVALRVNDLDWANLDLSVNKFSLLILQESSKGHLIFDIN